MPIVIDKVYNLNNWKTVLQLLDAVAIQNVQTWEKPVIFKSKLIMLPMYAAMTGSP